MTTAQRIRIGTRKSKLALWQTRHVAAQLESAWPDIQCELVEMSTQGDRRLDKPLPEIGGKGLFTAELEHALIAGDIDLAVHSLKDLPVEEPPGLTIGAILTRADVRDVLIARESWTLATLPHRAVVGTSSLRRQAQLAALRPDLDIRPIRGNVDTRLRKVMDGEYHATLLAAAGITRLDLALHVSEWLALDLMLPAPGQGALAVQCRADDRRMLTWLAALDDRAVRAAVTAERYLLWQLGGGCSAPVAAHATTDPDAGTDWITLRARVASLDGRHMIEAQGRGEEPLDVAARVAHALFDQGVQQILAAARSDSGTLPANSVQAARPLAGKRILVTRPADQAAELVALLEAAGAHVVALPTIQTEPVAISSSVNLDLAAYRWVLFTSANAVRYFFDQLPDAFTQFAHGRGPSVAAVGPSTHAALTQLGIVVDVMPADHTAAALATALGDVRGARLLLPRSAIADPELPAALRGQGALVDELPIYTTLPATADAAALAGLTAGELIDAVTFTSPSTVRGLAQMVQATPQLAAVIEQAYRVCIGPTTAAALTTVEELPPAPHVVADVHSARGLVDALIAALDAQESGLRQRRPQQNSEIT